MYHTVEFNIFAENLNDIVFDELRRKKLQENDSSKRSDKFPEPIPKPSLKSLEGFSNRGNRKIKK